jgi:hypothetical protein
LHKDHLACLAAILSETEHATPHADKRGQPCKTDPESSKWKS